MDVVGEGVKYECECGLLEHFGLPCAHILRVSAKIQPADLLGFYCTESVYSF